MASLWVRRLSVDARRRLRRGGGRLRPEASGIALELPRPLLTELGAESLDFALMAATWRAACRPPARPLVMGILNVTDDSFSDGGRFRESDEAVAQGLKLLAEGADQLDVGGESTRPGARTISVAEELDRVLPVIERLAATESPVISIDTQKSQVADAALRAGASIVNDVSGGTHDPAILDVAAEHDAGLVLMHMQGRPETMQRDPHYSDVVGEVHEWLRERVAAGLNAGVALSKIVVDPGIGFGKRLDDNVKLLRATSELRSLGLPVLVGVSRKSCLGALSLERRFDGPDHASERDVETQSAIAITTALGADVQRVHDVPLARRTLAIAHALSRGASSC